MKTLLIATLLLACVPKVSAQDLLPEAPAHHFVDKQNLMLASILATEYSLDGYTTRRILGNPRGHEMNPIAAPFVYSTKGAAGYMALSLAANASVMYVLHRTRHHKLERIVGWCIVGEESWAVSNNFYQLNKRKW